MKDNIFVLWNAKDLESQEIINILKADGYQEGKDLVIVHSDEPAQWRSLDQETKEYLKESGQRFRITPNETRPTKSIISMHDIQRGLISKDMIKNAVKMKPDFSHVIGINIQGDSPCSIIKTTKEKSALHAVAEKIGVELTLEQIFIGERASGGEYAVKALAKSLWLSEKEYKEIEEKIKSMEAKIQPSHLVKQLDPNKTHLAIQLDSALNGQFDKLGNITDIARLNNGCMVIQTENFDIKNIPILINEKFVHKEGLLIFHDNTNTSFTYIGPESFCEQIEKLPNTNHLQGKLEFVESLTTPLFNPKLQNLWPKTAICCVEHGDELARDSMQKLLDKYAIDPIDLSENITREEEYQIER